jgi:hypothetical protein
MSVTPDSVFWALAALCWLFGAFRHSFPVEWLQAGLFFAALAQIF